MPDKRAPFAEVRLPPKITKPEEEYKEGDYVEVSKAYNK